jgi:hypothetical protein
MSLAILRLKSHFQLGRFELPQGYPKKSPKSEEVERAAVQ